MVHEDHGVGRYRGLKTLSLSGAETEFLVLEYANQDLLYVPVSSLHLVSRYTGASEDHAPLHRLGGEAWKNIKRRAVARTRDVAAELLDIYSRREAKKGYQYVIGHQELNLFGSTFSYEETPDQQKAIDDVIDDMKSKSPWIALCAVMSALVRPKLPCALPLLPLWLENRSPCWCLRPC